MKRTIRPIHVGLGVMCVALGAMWVYAFFLAPKQPVDLIGDRAWVARSEAICAPVKLANDGLPTAKSFASMEPRTAALTARAAVADEITTNLRAMVTALRASAPSDVRGERGVALWLDEFERYLTDRDEQVAAWRAGRDEPFAETVNELGAPASARMDVYVTTNKMKSCRTPGDIG